MSETDDEEEPESAPAPEPQTMRAAMAAACHEETIGFEALFIGKVRLTPDFLAGAEGIDEKAKTKYLLAQARIGCSQKCGCQSASAEIQQVTENGGTVMYVLARCNQSPSALALGHRLKD